VKRPVGFIRGEPFTCSEYDTYVEAAIASSVAGRVFERKVACMPPTQKMVGGESDRNLLSNATITTFNIYLTHGSRLPDSFKNNDIKEFARPCVKLFCKDNERCGE